MPAPNIPTLSVSEVAERTGLCIDTVRRKIRKREFTAYKIGREWKMFASDIDLWVARQCNHQLVGSERSLFSA